MSQPQLLRLTSREQPAWTPQLGHGKPTPFEAEAAFARARDAHPDPDLPSSEFEAQGVAIGDLVSVAADDYGRDPITGVVSHVSRQRIALRRSTSEVGDVVVHLPRAGFMVRKA